MKFFPEFLAIKEHVLFVSPILIVLFILAFDSSLSTHNLTLTTCSQNYLHLCLIVKIRTTCLLYDTEFHENMCIFSLCLYLFIQQRRLNVDCYNISPDLNFILLYECQQDSDSNGTKYFVYEIFSTNIYPLTPNGSDEVVLQKILWSPGSYDSSNLAINDDIDSLSTNKVSNVNNRPKNVLPNSKTKIKFEKSKLAQAIAFIHDYDIYFKPKIHSDLVIRVTTNGKLLIIVM